MTTNDIKRGASAFLILLALLGTYVKGCRRSKEGEVTPSSSTKAANAKQAQLDSITD